MLPRSKRLAGKRSVQRVYQKGSRRAGQFLLLRTIPGRESGRVAVVVSAAVAKKATVRNRAKRVIRALLAKRHLPAEDMIVSVKRLPEDTHWSAIFDQELSQWLPK